MPHIIFQALLQGWPLLLILLAVITGRTVEYRHFRALTRREQTLSHVLLTDLKTFPHGADPTITPMLVGGQVVIATDYFKSFLAGIPKIFGGELKSYESLLERARREAVLRLLEEADRNGCNTVCNLRLNFADIGMMAGPGGKGAAMVEVFANGTAYRRPQESAHEKTPSRPVDRA